jgi:N-acetylmuramoyl-L-alanine amidase
MKVYLDAGHGGRDSGAVGGVRLEKDDCQMLTNLVSDLLQNSGITVVVNTNPDENLSEVASQANAENVDLFISIHRNAFNDLKANGLEVWTCLNARPTTKANAKIMYDKLMSVTNEMTGRGVKESNFYVLKYTNMPAMLLEVGFITNQHDNALFDKYIFDYATAIAQAICEIVKIPFLAKTQKTYTVQLANYIDKKKAESVLQDAKNKGFGEACIVWY